MRTKAGPAVAAAVALCLAAPATAAISTEGEGIVRLLCSDQAGAAHPSRAELLHALQLDEGDTFEITQVVAIYEPDSGGPTGERMIVRAQVEKADGTVVRLGKMSARRDADGELEAEKEVAAVTVGSGDVIRWRFKFRNFGSLGSESLGDCFVLFTLAGTLLE